MSRKSKQQKPSPETASEALQTAKSIQRPGQTKEQTRLVAQGIQKGIDLYKKQHKAKARELDKRLRKAQSNVNTSTEVDVPKQIVYRQHWLPWTLLILSWLGIGAYFFTL